MSKETIVVNGRELTAFDLPPEPNDEYVVHVDGLGEVIVHRNGPKMEDVPSKYMRKMVAGLCEQNTDLYRENAKLRELVRMMLRVAGVAEYATDSEWQTITDYLGELGVEVDA